MAVSATTHINVQNGGSDTICGGGFDPSQTAGMWTDGAATLATSAQPRFTSASYTFLIGDVGAYLFIGAGTNWTKGWYLIADTDSGAALLTATASGYQPYGNAVNTSAGCASVASPTGATWAVDYSQQAAAEFSGTDGTAAGAGSTLSSATIIFAKHMVGNVVRITAGTNATAGHHVITSVAAGVATFNNAVTTGATSDTTIYVGGALATPGYAGAAHIGSNVINVKYHATAYGSTNTTSNVALGRLTMTAGATTAYTVLRGYDVFPGDETGNRPTMQWGVNAASNFLVTGTSRTSVMNIILDGNRANFTNPGGFGHGGGQGHIYNVKIMGCTVATSFGSATVDKFEQTNCTATINATGAPFSNCYFHDNTVGVMTASTGTPTFRNCIFDTNGGAGITITGAAFGVDILGCTFYGNTGAGVDITSAPLSVKVENCIFESNTTHGVKTGGNYGGLLLVNNAYYNNGTLPYAATVLAHQNIGTIIYTATAFVDAANGDFRLNNAAGRALKIAGMPTTFPGLTWRNYSGMGAGGSNPNASGGGAFQPF